jgi:hypothetical protein
MKTGKWKLETRYWKTDELRFQIRSASLAAAFDFPVSNFEFPFSTFEFPVSNLGGNAKAHAHIV